MHDQAARAQDAPPTTFDYGDLEGTLERAVHMSSIAVTLMEKAFNVYEHYGDKEHHEKRRQEGRSCETYLIHDEDEGTLLFSLYEAAAQIREARDQFVNAVTAAADNKGPQATAGAIETEGH